MLFIPHITSLSNLQGIRPPWKLGFHLRLVFNTTIESFLFTSAIKNYLFRFLSEIVPSLRSIASDKILSLPPEHPYISLLPVCGIRVTSLSLGSFNGQD